MPKRVFSIYNLIVINKIFISGIVGWINVNNINLVLVRKIQNGQRVIVVALNQKINWLVFVVFNFLVFNFFQNRKLFWRKIFRHIFPIYKSVKDFLRILFIPNETVLLFFQSFQFVNQ